MKVESREPLAAPKRDAGGRPESRESNAENTVKAMPETNPLLVLISAPSGGGKTTICHELLKARPDMTRAVTCTTREARPGEKDGADYYFLDAGSFLKRV